MLYELCERSAADEERDDLMYDIYETQQETLEIMKASHAQTQWTLQLVLEAQLTQFAQAQRQLAAYGHLNQNVNLMKDNQEIMLGNLRSLGDLNSALT